MDTELSNLDDPNSASYKYSFIILNKEVKNISEADLGPSAKMLYVANTKPYVSNTRASGQAAVLYAVDVSSINPELDNNEQISGKDRKVDGFMVLIKKCAAVTSITAAPNVRLC